MSKTAPVTTPDSLRLTADKLAAVVSDHIQHIEHMGIRALPAMKDALAAYKEAVQ